MATPYAHEAYVGLGSNLDDPQARVLAALAALGRIESTMLIARSSLYRSTPVGYLHQPDFINAVAKVRTALGPTALLQALLGLEQTQGRRRTRRNGPRTLDLDLLLFDASNIDEHDLIVPHPRMHERAFVLVPLTEIAPEIEIPGRGRAAAWLAAVGTGAVARIPA